MKTILQVLLCAGVVIAAAWLLLPFLDEVYIAVVDAVVPLPAGW